MCPPEGKREKYNSKESNMKRFLTSSLQNFTKTSTILSFPLLYDVATGEVENDIPCRGQIHFSCFLSKLTGFQTCRTPQSP